MQLSLVRCCADMVLVAALAVAAPVAAEQVHGRLLGQAVASHTSADSLPATFLGPDRQDLNGSLRLSWSPRLGDWRFDAAYKFDVVGGDEPLLNSRLADSGVFATPPPTTAWDDSDTVIDKRRVSAVQTVERLSVGYAGIHWIVRAGRQALSWGSGLVFHPMDLFDPFPPDALDVEFKPGTDMLYAQYLFDDGSDIQFVAVPRPARRGASLKSDASSVAVMWRRRIADVQSMWLLAEDRDDMVVALSLAGTLGGASWTAEIVPTFFDAGGRAVSALFNLSNAGRLWGREVIYFAELYRNGFGTTGDSTTLASLPAELSDRLLRGQVFTAGRHQVATGTHMQITPLLEISPTVIADLDDASTLALVEANYSLSDNLTLDFGTQVPIGPRGTRFGGIGVDADAPLYIEPPSRAYLQIRYYF